MNKTPPPATTNPILRKLVESRVVQYNVNQTLPSTRLLEQIFYTVSLNMNLLIYLFSYQFLFELLNAALTLSKNVLSNRTADRN